MQPAPTPPAPAVGYTNTVRIGYARVSGRAQDHQMQLDALADADCREVIVETASTRGECPKLHATLNTLQADDTLVIYKPDRIARSMTIRDGIRELGRSGAGWRTDPAAGQWPQARRGGGP